MIGGSPALTGLVGDRASEARRAVPEIFSLTFHGTKFRWFFLQAFWAH
jgi:hypothetical protein